MRRWETPQRDPGNRTGQCGRGKRPQVEAVEDRCVWCGRGYGAAKLKPYRKASTGRATTGKGQCKCSVSRNLWGKSPQLASNPFSRWRQKQAIKRSMPPPNTPVRLPEIPPRLHLKTGKAARTVKERRHSRPGHSLCATRRALLVGGFSPHLPADEHLMSSLLHDGAEHWFVLSGTTYPSDDLEMLAVEADYAAREAAAAS